MVGGGTSLRVDGVTVLEGQCGRELLYLTSSDKACTHPGKVELYHAVCGLQALLPCKPCYATVARIMS